MGSLDYDGIRVDIPNALTCLSRNLNPCNYDLSGLGPGLGVVDETRTNMNQDLGGRFGHSVENPFQRVEILNCLVICSMYWATPKIRLNGLDQI